MMYSPEITIKCPRNKVSAYAANPDHAPIWYVNIRSAEWQTPKPLKIGSKIAFKAQFLGKQLSYVYQIAAYIPGEILQMKTADGPFQWKPLTLGKPSDGNSTRMTLRNKGNPSGFSKLFAPFMSVMMKRANNKDLKRIKYVLENESNEE